VNKPKWIFMPDSPFRLFWDFVIVLMLMYTVIIMPVRVAFPESDDNIHGLALDICVDILFISDTILNFFFAYERRNGEVITNHKLIAKKYLKNLGFSLILFLQSHSILCQVIGGSLFKF